MHWYYSPLGMILEEKNTSIHPGFVRLPNGPLLSIAGPDGVFYYFVDAADNVIGIVDSRGTADWYADHPFGQDLGAQGTTYNTSISSWRWPQVVRGRVGTILWESFRLSCPVSNGNVILW